MESKKIISDSEIADALHEWGWGCSIGEGRLMLAQLLVKAGAGAINSCTEEGFLRCFNVLQKNRTPNKKGRLFLCRIFYKHSNYRPECYRLMRDHRRSNAE